MKQTLAWKAVWPFLPYLYFMGLAVFWFVNELFQLQQVSFLALGIMLVLVAQATVQHKIVGVSLGVLAVAVHLLFFLAVLSEFHEFDQVSASALKLITVGSVLSLLGIAMGGLMTTTNVRKLTL